MLEKVVLLATLASFTAAAWGEIVRVGPDDFLVGSTFVDFETGSTGTPQITGIDFVDEGSPSSPPWFQGNASFSSALFGEQLYAPLVSVTLADLAIEFSPAFHAVGAWIGAIPNRTNYHADSVLFRILDSSGQLIWDLEFNIPAVDQPPIFFGVRSDTLIGRVEWLGGNTGIFAIDNLLAGNAVPEPSTLLLLVASMAFIVHRR